MLVHANGFCKETWSPFVEELGGPDHVSFDQRGHGDSERPLLPIDWWDLGRDVLSRLIYGARNTVGIAFVTTIFAFTIGGGFGITAAINNGGWLDNLLSRSVDVLMAIPSLIFALILLSMFGATTLNLIVIIAVLDSTDRIPTVKRHMIETLRIECASLIAYTNGKALLKRLMKRRRIDVV